MRYFITGATGFIGGHMTRVLRARGDDVGELAAIAVRVSGIPATRLRVPPWLMRASVPLLRAIELVASLPPVFSSESVRVMSGMTCLVDGGRAERELGSRPRPIEEGVREGLAHEERLLGRTPPRALHA